MKGKVYISGALTNGSLEKVEHMKQFYEAIAEVCEKRGYSAYVPHRHTDPIANTSVLPDDVYKIDMREVANADLILAYMGMASHGVGMEIERAYHEGRKVVLIYEQGTKVSRLPRGCPAVVAEIQFAGQEDALGKIASFLEHLPLLDNK